jgi:hypothetical protein
MSRQDRRERKAEQLQDHDPQATRQARLMREKALYRYTTALESGDMNAIADVWHEAEQDAPLEQMLLDIHSAYTGETEEDLLPARSEQVDQTRNRLLALLDEQEDEVEDEIGTLPSGPLKYRRRCGMRFLVQAISAVLIIAVLIGSAVLIFANRNTQVGSRHAHPPLNSKFCVREQLSQRCSGYCAQQYLGGWVRINRQRHIQRGELRLWTSID